MDPLIAVTVTVNPPLVTALTWRHHQLSWLWEASMPCIAWRHPTRNQLLIATGPTPPESNMFWKTRLVIVAAACHKRSCTKPASRFGDWQKSRKMRVFGAFSNLGAGVEPSGVLKELGICGHRLLVISDPQNFSTRNKLYNHWICRALPGYSLCKTAWLRFLGIGKARLQRTGKRFRGIDERTINQGCLSANMCSMHASMNRYVSCTHM